MGDKYTFRREFTDMYGKTKVVEHTFEGETLGEIMEEFLYFLNGCSFLYVKDLIWVKDNGQEEAILDWQADNLKTVSDVDDIINELNDRFDPIP